MNKNLTQTSCWVKALPDLYPDTSSLTKLYYSTDNTHSSIVVPLYSVPNKLSLFHCTEGGYKDWLYLKLDLNLLYPLCLPNKTILSHRPVCKYEFNSTLSYLVGIAFCKDINSFDKIIDYLNISTYKIKEWLPRPKLNLYQKLFTDKKAHNGFDNITAYKVLSHLKFEIYQYLEKYKNTGVKPTLPTNTYNR